MIAQTTICITDTDHARLRSMMKSLRSGGDVFRGYIRQLDGELARARFVPANEVDPDVVTMNSRVEVRDLDDDELSEFELAYHRDADGCNGRVSVLAPLGMALLGTRVGDLVEWPVPAGLRRLKVEQILYQPEAAGDFDL
jgi:regulator of nucleoside diphosphate kinase